MPSPAPLGGGGAPARPCRSPGGTSTSAWWGNRAAIHRRWCPRSRPLPRSIPPFPPMNSARNRVALDDPISGGRMNCRLAAAAVLVAASRLAAAQDGQNQWDPLGTMPDLPDYVDFGGAITGIGDGDHLYALT